MNAYVVFSDLNGFSKLSEPEIRKLSSELLGAIYRKVERLVRSADVFNTWGDACFAIFQNGKDAVQFCIEYKKAFEEIDFRTYGIKSVRPRIAAHFGEFLIYRDEYLGKNNAIGWIINTAARIEPITKVGEIYVTKNFKDNIEALPEKIQNICFDELGVLPLAKNFGDFELYKLRLNSEAKTILDRLSKREISEILPEPPGLNAEEIKLIDFLKTSPTIELFRTNLSAGLSSNISDEGKKEVARICKDYGEFETAIRLIDEIESSILNVDGFKLRPYAYNIEVSKIKANCLSRLGRYEEAASLVYGLWHMGLRDADTLSMLAAQYKRKALFKDKRVVVGEMNEELLIRARDIYLEAFRLNISDYYPAINAAYLYKIIRGIEEGKGIKLADYIIQQWNDVEHKDWWLSSTLAECELIKNDYEEFIRKCNENIERYKPNVFEKEALKEQLLIFNSFYTNEAITRFIETL